VFLKVSNSGYSKEVGIRYVIEIILARVKVNIKYNFMYILNELDDSLLLEWYFGRWIFEILDIENFSKDK